MNDWICSQFGGREKYAVPRALNRRGLLQKLYTDIWIRPDSIINKLNKRLRGRFHPELKGIPVADCADQIFFHKIKKRLFRKPQFPDLAYDNWVSSKLLRGALEGPANFFGYSYSSVNSMKTAKALGYKTILGQINPGPGEASIVVEEFRRYRGGNHKPTVPDERYWDRWREEVKAADRILVNSLWSMQLLKAAGVPPEKCVIVPLAYEAGEIFFERKFRNSFDHGAPLRLLYLGGIGIRKGFHLLTEAMRLLTSHPVRLDVVGVLKGPKELIHDLPPNIALHGAVPPNAVSNYYRSADLFVFPTLSDGFGLTQLEAQAYKLPVIASRSCAPVITHMHNGFILSEVSAHEIKGAVTSVLDHPAMLQQWSHNSDSLENYSIGNLSSVLANL